MENKMFTVSIDKEFDITKKEFNSSIYLRVYTSLFQAGIVKDLKPTNFTVLLAIASHMDADGNCYPTQRQIAELTGITPPTVNKAVNELLEYKVNDKPIISREFVQSGQFKNSYYTVNPLSQIAIFDGLVKEIEVDEPDLLKNVALNKSTLSIPELSLKEGNADEDKKIEQVIFKNAKEVATYFLQKYQEHYGVQCSIAWQRDLSLIKKKLIATYSDIQIKKMIDTVISDYDSRWSKPSYPRPTISMMCSWLGEQALAVAEAGEKELQELTELTAGSDEANIDVLKKFGL
jgi:DNA-binding MarR family transcriptional regulator